MPGSLGSSKAADSLFSCPSTAQEPLEVFCTTQRPNEMLFCILTSYHYPLPSYLSVPHKPDSNKKNWVPTVGFLLGVTISSWHGSEAKRWSRKWGRAEYTCGLSEAIFSPVKWRRRNRLSCELLSASTILQLKGPSWTQGCAWQFPEK